MPRLYGATTADYTIAAQTVVSGISVTTAVVSDTTVVTGVATTTAAGLTQLAAGSPLAVATAPDPATRVTSGLTDLAGNPVTEVVSDDSGEIRFQGDEGLPLDLWLTTIDANGNLGSVWYVVHAAELGAEVSAAAASAEAAAASAQAAVAGLPADLTAQLDAIRARLDDLEAGGVPNAVTSPDGSVTTLQAGTAAANDVRRASLSASDFLLDVG